MDTSLNRFRDKPLKRKSRAWHQCLSTAKPPVSSSRELCNNRRVTNDLGLIQKLTRLYTFYSPIRKGKYRLAQASLKLASTLPEQVVVTATDGRRLRVNFDDHLSQLMYFLGEYERPISEIVRTFVTPGDVCVDVGANIGWYTTLMQKLVGARGSVHAFEPVPTTFNILTDNVASNDHSGSVILNNLALGEEAGEVEMHTFDDRSTGHASISDFGDATAHGIPTQMIRLNDYLSEKRLEDVKFVKIDIEGAELSMLKGSSRLFEQTTPPIIVIEAALATTQAFGYLPDDLLDLIGSRRDYYFYEVDNIDGSLREISRFGRESIGANVLCVPSGSYLEERAALGIS
jgi:FkbM family methyltransferase